MEPILTDKRYCIFPINTKYQDLWDLYMVQEAAFWRAQEIDYTADAKDWESLGSDERMFIENILAFFASSDGIVMENISCNFADEVTIPEARAFYAIQNAIENVHSITYSLLIDTLVKDAGRKADMFNAIEKYPFVKKKADWAKKYMGSDVDFATRLVAFAVVEGVFFSGAFCSIFWLKDRGLMVKALGHSNELISRDEGLHVKFAVALFGHLLNKPTTETVHDLFREAVGIEIEFICDSIPCAMIGMNRDTMSQYIRFVSDRLLAQLGYPKLFNDENPFDFMEKIGMEGKTNFFEKRTSEYQLSSKGDDKVDFDDMDVDF